jgi:hypothetical protein
MDSIGDYIYLIVIVVVAIGGIFKKKNQQKQKPVVEPPKTKVEDILREFMNESKPIVSEPVVVTIDPPAKKDHLSEVKTERFISYENSEDINSLKAKREIVKHDTDLKKIQSDFSKKKSDDLIDELSTMSIEDVRKAIIFSEIINRKYK